MPWLPAASIVALAACTAIALVFFCCLSPAPASQGFLCFLPCLWRRPGAASAAASLVAAVAAAVPEASVAPASASFSSWSAATAASSSGSTWLSWGARHARK